MGSWLRLGGLGALGMGCLVAALAGYRSFEEHAVLGRWSWTFAGLLAALGATTLALAARAWWRARRTAERDAGGLGGARFPWAGSALLAWGGAQLLSSRLDNAALERLLGGGLCASVHPLPLLLEWVAMVLFAVAVARAFAPGLWDLARRSRGGRAGLVNVGLAVTALAVAGLAGEGLARARVAIHPTVQGFPSQSTLAWRRRYAPLNAEGQRDRIHPLSAPDGRARLVVIGDSVAWGWGVERTTDRFGERLAALLTEAGPRPWEAMTMARSDTHTLHHLEFLERSLAYRPDLAILLYVFNDIDYLARVTPRRSLGQWHPLRILIANSCLAQEVAVRVWLLSRAPPGTADPYLDAGLVRRHLEDVRRFVDRAASSGARPLVVPLDVRVSQPGEARARYEAFVREAEALDLPVVRLDTVFHEEEFDELTVNRIDRHPNARAHALAAAVVAARLRDGTR